MIFHGVSHDAIRFALSSFVCRLQTATHMLASNPAANLDQFMAVPQDIASLDVHAMQITPR